MVMHAIVDDGWRFQTPLQPLVFPLTTHNLVPQLKSYLRGALLCSSCGGFACINAVEREPEIRRRRVVCGRAATIMFFHRPSRTSPRRRAEPTTSCHCSQSGHVKGRNLSWDTRRSSTWATLVLGYFAPLCDNCSNCAGYGCRGDNNICTCAETFGGRPTCVLRTRGLQAIRADPTFPCVQPLWFRR
ncbi:hypothetical protein EXIGLDRAFT_1534 [Exidia glandulosa HHB12029]|uniref:Uncharacterized protein n=1 Tax=Exidia glandulosa HHB12029 TaxID=1314781 RepID=A0A166BST4_EXIGL|nr:hypothetical protein EXIGLDRAFT_1534 [Exidia glandulosa HHB12029]